MRDMLRPADRPSARSRGRPKAFHDRTAAAVIQSLDRAVGVLRVVAGGTGLSLTEVAQAAGQSPATCYRILTTLRRHGIVEFEEAGQLWRIGPEAFRIGSAFLGRTRMSELSRPVMQRIMAETGETANLAILDGTEVMFVSQVETNEPIRAFFRPGTRGPGHASGIGKAIMAWLPAARLEGLLGGTLERFTPRTRATAEALREDLAAIRVRGWAVDDEERTEGMRCIAAPVFNQWGEPVAGISVSGPAVRMRPVRDEATGRLVRAAADEITRATGGVVPPAAGGAGD
ncbi:MAG: IclR family transcriptional regulator [Rhodobacteraceae bacterium]|nr:IclR family transcriptional regulator [Paracoccaceae bacterium]